MNVILITLAIIILCIVITIQYANNVKLTKQNEVLVEQKRKAEIQTHDVVKVAKSILHSIYNDAGILPTDRIPFVSKEHYLSIKKSPLDAIRLRLKEGKVSIYTNGIINPTKDIVILDDITSLNNEHLELITTFIGVIEQSNIDAPIIPLTPQKIIHFLTFKD